MGLFSFLSKNKQDAAGEDSAFYSNADDASVTAKARSKRASSAGRAASDPGLPEKKRARRRLVGAIALALAVAIGLPMVLDSEPKPLASDIAIQIPSKDKLSLTPALSQDAVNNAAVKSAAKETQEQVERAATEKAAAEQAAQEKAAAKPAEAPVALKPEPKLEAKAEPKTEPKADTKVVEVPKEKPAAKPPVAKPEGDDAARALAILEGKGADAAGPKFMINVVALATPERITEAQEKLKAAGFKPTIQKVPTEAGERTRVRVGPFGKDEAEKVRVRLGRMGFNAVAVVPAV
jgi:DedD protein